MSTLNLIMPVYNESEVVDKVVIEWCQKLRELNIDFKFHAYNDGSTDHTESLLKQLCSEYPELIVHTNPNQGHGPTVLQGYLENLDSDWLFQIDSDGEISPRHFDEFWNSKDNFDLVIGKRLNYGVNLTRKIVTRAAHLFVRLFFGNKIHDTNVPYRLMRVSSYRDIFPKIPRDAFTSNVILSAISNSSNVRVKQIDINHNFRTTGESIYVGKRFIKGVFLSFTQALRFRFLNV